MNSVMSTVSKYMTKSAPNLIEEQVVRIPRLETNIIDYVATHYFLNGARIPVNISKQLFIKLKFLRFRSYKKRIVNANGKSIPTAKFIKYHSGVFKLQEIVQDGIIYPFMLFINGYFIPWECISIVIEGDEIYHIVVDGTNNTQVVKLCKNCDFAQIVTLPEYCVCVNNKETDYPINPVTAMFSFDQYGKFDVDDATYCITSATGYTSLGFNYWHTNQPVNAFRVLNQQDIKLTEANIMLFVNGLFGTGIREKIPRAIDSDYKYPDGYIAPCIEYTYTKNFITENPVVRMDSSLLTINNGLNEGLDVYDFGLFVNPEYGYTIDNISRVKINELTPVIQEYNMSGDAPEYLPDLLVPFELSMTHKKMYPENLADALKTISQYNADLFTSIFKDSSNLIIEEHDYEWISAHTQGGAIILPVSYGDMINEYIVVLVNGRLYEYSHMIKYFANKILIPIQNINPDDTIEFLRFKNINNFEKKVIINESDGYINYSSDIINDKLCFFTTEYNDAAYTFPKENIHHHFEVAYKLEKNQYGLTKIVFEDPYYYGKELIMTYKDRFKWEVFTVKDTGGHTEYCIDLGDRFKYCNQYHRFLVFLNYNRLSSDHYRLTLPVRPTTPFTEFKLYLTIPINEGDRLDIMYTPAMFQDIIVRDTIDVSGDIVIDKKVLDYGLTTDLFMVWINGKKVSQSNISDIDATHIRVTSDEKSTSTLCITKFIPSITAIDEAFDNNTALWDTITSVMSAEDINKILGIKTNTITNTEDNRYADAASIKQIMNELIRDEFINNPSIDLSGPFVYDYLDVDTSIVSGYDEEPDNGARLETMDANHEDNLDILEREYP